MLKPIHNQFVILPITVKGKDFVLQYIKVNPGDSNLEQEADDIKAKGFYGHYPLKNLDSLPKCFEENKHHPIWEEEGSRCLSCGSCILVCPTCYCFDVADELALNLKTGERLRRWDACMLHAFSTVSGGENFRKKATERLKHRIHRKFNYLMKKHGQSVCVGCGRCVKACLAKISPKQIAQKIVGEIA